MNINEKFHRCMEGRKVVVDILSILFGLGSWIGVNGMFQQLPLLVKTAPEGWTLPSYMSITVEMANLGPVTYAILRKLFPRRLNDAYCIHFVHFLGFISALLLAFIYNYTSVIGGEEHSTAFLILVFFTAIVGCTSSVLFFPFMRHFKETYLISYFIGEGSSGFLAGIVALSQGVGGKPDCNHNDTSGNPVYEEPIFNTHYFFGFVAFIILLSLNAFILLNNLSICKSEKVSLERTSTNAIVEEQLDSDQNEVIENSPCEPTQNKESIGLLRRLILLFLVLAFICNGVLPSVQSYSCLPYGYTAYHLAVTLSSMASPVTCLITAFLPRASIRCILIISSVCGLIASYIFATSLLSPTPPLYTSVFGGVIAVIEWIAVVGLLSYVKVNLSKIFQSAGGSWMFYCGGVAQLGSASGSLVAFFLINFTHIFVSKDPCE